MVDVFLSALLGSPLSFREQGIDLVGDLDPFPLTFHFLNFFQYLLLLSYTFFTCSLHFNLDAMSFMSLKLENIIINIVDSFLKNSSLEDMNKATEK